MAFGGVATGSMKAKDAETAVGMRVLNGLTLACRARLSIIGVKICVVAVLLAISVVVETTILINIPKTPIGTQPRD